MCASIVLTTKRYLLRIHPRHLQRVQQTLIENLMIPFIFRRTMTERKIVSTLQNDEVITALHSHLSRQFVSNFAGYFTMYAVFLVYFFNVLVSPIYRTAVGNPLLNAGVVVTLAAALVFLMRTVGFGKALDTMETKYLRLATNSNETIDAHEWFRKELCVGKIHFLFRISRRLSTVAAIVLIVLSAVISLILINTPWLHPLLPPVSQT